MRTTVCGCYDLKKNIIIKIMVYKLKAKHSEMMSYLLFLNNFLKGFIVGNMKDTGLKKYVISIDHDSFG